jgi:hypothetical protein
MNKMPPFYFYVDEFQNFANDSFANILSEARKYKLCLTVANQYVNQMAETIRDAVFGNMGTTVSFRVGPLDSELLEKVFTPVFTANDLENLQFGQFYVTLQIDNMGSRPFSAQTMGPLDRVETSYREAVIANSQKQFARPRNEVETEIIEWFGYNKQSVKPGSETKPQPTTPSARQTNNAITIQPLEITAPKTTKYVVADKSKTQSRKPIQKNNTDTPAPLSSKMNDLLGQLETSVTDEPVVKPVQEIEVKKNELPKIEPVTPIVAKSLDKPVKDRAAKPETKNALLEALEKAKKIKEDEQMKASQKPKTPTSDLSLKDMVTDVAHVEEIIKTTKATIPEPVIIEKTTIESKPVIENESHAVREVPEDILKKILE